MNCWTRLIHLILTACLTTQESLMKISQKKQGNNTGVQPLTIINEANLSALEREQLNTALRAMKNRPFNDWRSFENLANYHGDPPICDIAWTRVILNGVNGNVRQCCVHGGTPFSPLFLSWHRLFITNFFQCIISTGQPVTLPYWDWTSSIGLPQLALQFNEWRSGPIKGLNGLQTFRGQDALNNFDENRRANLQEKVTTALCTRNLANFDRQIEDPHNDVHVAINGDMGGTARAAYDPIFYLHHTYIDYLYAYWQELQDIRRLPRVESGQTSRIRMPPFSGITNNPSLGNSIPNPWENTRIFSTANDVDDYQRNFGYRYDRLVFNGYRPADFVRNEGILCNNRQIVRVAIANGEVSSTNEISVRGIDEIFGTFNVFGEFRTDDDRRRSLRDNIRSSFFEPYSLDIDVTRIFKKYNISPTNLTLDYQVKSYDLTGKPLKFSAYKPMAGFIDENSHRTYAILQESLDKYLPVIKFCDVHTKLKIYGNNGIENGDIDVTTTYQLTDNSRSLIVGPDMGCLLKNQGNKKKKKKSDNCKLQPTYPCKGKGCITVIHWRSVKKDNQEHTISCHNSAFVAWCSDEEADVHEVDNQKDYNSCSNMKMKFSDQFSDNDIKGFIINPGKTRYFVSKSQCRYGVKLKLVFEDGKCKD